MEENQNNSKFEGSIPIRFLLFPSGKETVRYFHPKNSFQQVKQQLVQDWPKDFEEVKNIEQLKFIYSGKVIPNEKLIEEVFKIENSPQLAAMTVHVFIKKESHPNEKPVPSVQTPQHPVNNPQPNTSTSNPIDVQNLHVHASLFGEEEETTYLKQIFEKKKGEDGKIELVELYKFLKTYWKFLADQHHIDPNREFPAKRFMMLKKKYVGDADRVTKEQFVTIYFLIDSKISKKQCPQGTKEIVKEAAIQLHRNLNPPIGWSQERFEELFRRIDRNEDSILSCREYDLFLYLYTLEVSDPKLLSS